MISGAETLQQLLQLRVLACTVPYNAKGLSLQWQRVSLRFISAPIGVVTAAGPSFSLHCSPLFNLPMASVNACVLCSLLMIKNVKVH